MHLAVEKNSVEQKFAKHSLAAQMHGVCPKTLDRWAELGLIPEPIRINKLKYHDLKALAAVGRRRG
jgi:hypothetical protein